MIMNMGGFSDSLRKLESEIIRVGSQIGDSPEKNIVINRASSILVRAMRDGAPVANRTLYRYRNGKKVATYEPGNLLRSIKILDHFKNKRANYVGVAIKPRGRGKGRFSGENVDGWYARFVERRTPFIRPAVDRVGDNVVGLMTDFVSKKIRQANAGT